MIIGYFWIVIRFVIFFSSLYGLYFYFVCIENFQFVQFITIIGIAIALLKDFIIELLFPPVFKIIISDSKPHYYEFQTTNKQEKQSWLAVEVKNVGLKPAKNVLVYFNGIESNIIDDFDAYLGLPIRKAFGENPIDKDPMPKSSIISVCDKFYYSFLKIRDVDPENIYFDFPDTPVAINKVKCEVNEDNFLKFKIKVTSDSFWALNKSSIFKLSYFGIYNKGISIQ